MIFNEISNALLGNTQINGIYLGTELIWPSIKNFNISWNTGDIQITAYNPPANENDRPRINTFRTDGNYVVYMSAGYILYNPNTYQNFTLWGNRSISSQQVPIPVFSLLSAGVDLFTTSAIPIPNLYPPLSSWIITSTGNIDEVKYQYIINRKASQNIDITINLLDINSVFWSFTKPTTGATISDFYIVTDTNDKTISWGDYTENKINSNVNVSHTY